jgi:hypothetical protein
VSRGLRLRRRTLAGLLLGLVLVGSACGGSDEEQDVTVIEDDGSGLLESPDDSTQVEAVAGMPDPCSLVTDDEVAAAVAAEPSDTTRTQLTPTSADCTFFAGDSPVAIVGIDVDPGSDLSDYEGVDPDAEAVDDLGEQATWSPVLGTVATTDGEHLVTVTLVITDQDPDDLRGPAVELAGAALGRL